MKTTRAAAPSETLVHDLQARHDRLEQRVGQLERQVKLLMQRLTEDELAQLERVEQ